ncbi:DUF3800 domain-containing protein [Rathayibacter rubneri]|uniref:DUF3800 domain-containing protein n=1 Tax=Rathayibacter rubneri TaxID=2950106 RepID=UPI0027E099C8|nr:DUF3800 domain-containing protein [Rathayibacter rubneri]
MHLCYVDDSGDSRHGVTLTGLIVEDREWSGLLNAWLAGRRAIHREFGVLKTAELHATKLYKGRGQFCETLAQNASFGTGKRAAAGRVMLSALAKHPRFEVVTVGMADRSKPVAYARFIAWLEDWAEREGTYVMVLYDGQQGLGDPGEELEPPRDRELWETAIRDAAPYREVHRSLDIQSRRVVEDVMMQDSRYSQLIQAADLIAYGAYQKHRQEHPEIWGGDGTPSADAIIAYMRLAARWPEGSDFGVHWLG